MCPQFPKQPPRAGGWAPQDRTVGRRSSPPPPTTTSCHPPSKNQTPALGPASPSKSGDAAATSPYPPHTPPSPTLPPCTRTRARPQSYTSSAGRGTSRTAVPHSRRGRCSPTPQAEGAGLALPRCGCRACPALFPFVDFGPSFTEALDLRSARALSDTTCPPLSDRFRHPPAGPSGPSSGPCLADTTCPPLSTCPVAPQSQAAPRRLQARSRRKIARTDHSSQFKPNPPPQPNAP